MDSFMRSRKNSTNKTHGAFTLMELLIVILILGMLAGLIVPNIIGQKDRAQQDLVCIQFKNVSQALELFKSDNGSYPETEEGLVALMTNPDEDKYTGFLPGGYIKGAKSLKDPWKHDYLYLRLDEGGYDIMSMGGDGKEGGTDGDKDIRLSTCK
jgi:general secretion pathway protein G